MVRLYTFMIAGIFLFSLSPGGLASAGNINIAGKAPGYAGEEIIFSRYTDLISFSEEEVFRAMVDENENFSASFIGGEEPQKIFSHAGRYFIYLYVESGMEYQVILPPRSERARHEKLNPYFEGIPTHIAVLNHDGPELNLLIRKFDDIYDPLIQVSLVGMSARESMDFVDSVSAVMDYHFDGLHHPWFEDYRKYRMAHLERMTRIRAARGLSDTYFRDSPVLYGNIAYMELFNQVYERYFLFFSRTVRGSRIFDDINNKRSLSSLMNTLQTDTVLGKDRLLEMVVLKGIHDAFYGSDFSRSGLLAVLDSLSAATRYPEHVSTARNIRDKLTRLMPGFDPPGFHLTGRDGIKKGLDDFRGYYVYLNFCMAASYSCLSEFEILNRLHADHRDYLKIVTVFIDEDPRSMMNFLLKNNYDWDFLHYGDQPSILRDYDVRMFPTYYLIDRNGKMLMAPAPSPAEDFEIYLFRTMRARGELIR
jgi:hypothetical protein